VPHPNKSHFVQARGGKLFDPDAFPFLEGKADMADAPRVPAVSDGCLLRVLEGLMTLQVKGGTRDRLSYRALDVEQIGSVYETVMGFTVETASGRSLAIKAGKHNRTPVFIDLDRLAAASGEDRIKFLKEEADRSQLSASVAKVVVSSASPAELAVALDPIVDERGSPKKHQIATGTPILQPTDERRRTGSHYTPRTLTAPIVKYALEPAFERLAPDATPEQILDLKVCDPAMGSGAFLVEACRALAARLTEAWSRHPGTKPTIPPDEDEELHARRLVAQRCLYGVDKNPLATDLAKLSLWLATLARDHEFTFLDHALKCGDSLVGLDAIQIAAMHWDTSKPGLPLFRKFVADCVAEATKARAEIQSAPDDTMGVVLEQKHRFVEKSVEPMRVLGDAVISAFFGEDKAKAREKRRATVESWVTGFGEAKWDELRAAAAGLRAGEHPVRPFHWGIEYPEVFSRENPGFDAIVGNPPFAGHSTLVASNRQYYSEWLRSRHEFAAGKSDLVAHFFRRSFSLIREGACFGLIATKTIRQGDTREAGLATIVRNGGAIARAIRRLKWPGDAAVMVSVVHVMKGAARSPILDGQHVRRISAYLVEGDLDHAPVRLAANARKAFQGSILLGMGFTFDDVAAAKGGAESLGTMHALIAKDPRNAERILPYLGGEEVNNSPAHMHHRHVIDFAEYPLRRDAKLLSWLNAPKSTREQWLRDGIVPVDYPDPVAEDWPDLLDIVERRVKPQRIKAGTTSKSAHGTRAAVWWKHYHRAATLYDNVVSFPQVLAVNCGASPHLAFGQLRTGSVYANTLDIIAFPNLAPLAVLQSRPHEIWARFFASSMKDDLRYTPSDCFETFPFPECFETSSALEAVGKGYHDRRAALMVARNEGMTKTYNRFHDPTETAEDIQRLRELHATMDHAVLEAYGWCDLAARAAPIFLDETSEDDHTYQGRLFWPSDFPDEVLARLLALNAERHAEEVRLGIAPGMRVKAEADDEDDDEIERA